MAQRNRRTKVVDGYTALKAAQRAGQAEAQADRAAAAPPAPDRKAAPPGGTPARRIAHTALPTKHEITCYECGYEFHLTGRAEKTACPKCRRLLKLTDYTIEGEWTETVKTAGTIHVKPAAVVKSGELFATDVVLEGKVEDALVRATRWLELGGRAEFPEKNVTGQDLRVAAGGDVSFKRKATYRRVEVFGSLTANLQAAGLVTVKSGGCLKGQVHGEHLVVEEGGGLVAKVAVEPLPPAGEQAKAKTPLRKTA